MLASLLMSIETHYLKIKNSDYCILFSEELHAELCYAEALMVRAILSFFHDESLASFVRGAFKIRSGYQGFRFIRFQW